MADGELQTDEAPDDIVFTDQVMSVAFHPEKNIVAASTVRPLLISFPLYPCSSSWISTTQWTLAQREELCEMEGRGRR